MMQLDDSKRRAILLGLLIGDALGVPYEFQAANSLPAKDLIDFEPPVGFRRSHRGVPSGTWSDDGAHALALLDSLHTDRSLDLKHFSRCLLEWRGHGWYTPDGVVFDIGIQTSAALQKLSAGVPPELSGPRDERSNGNGSLMRALSCLLVPMESEEDLVDRALRQSLPTHAHPRSQVCCALLVLTGWHLAHGVDPQTALASAAASLARAWSTQPALAGELRFVLAERSQPAQGSGYVVDSFWSAWQALSTQASYAACVRHAVSMGNDTDTTACIAGGLAGARWGEESLPAAWVDQLQGRGLALALLSGPRASSPFDALG